MMQPSTVTVRRLDTGDLPVKSLPVMLDPPPAGLKVTSSSVQPSNVRLVAAPELLSRLREVAGSVTYRPGTYTAPVTLRLPAGAQALEEVTVRLTVVTARPVAVPATPAAPLRANPARRPHLHRPAPAP
ncbi:hypothetical protein ACFSC4_10110 [Deinococcus malanensis]|uniref:hypothetical protein n=1 Tax=Deinococcus malanensis TaxID=1706855 RepID=UPI00363C3FAC